MTSISVNLSSSASSTRMPTGATDSLGKKIADLKQQVQDLYKQARELKDTKLSPAEKDKQQRIIQASIQMLQAEIARLEKERASQGKQGGTEPSRDPKPGTEVKTPTASVASPSNTGTQVDDFA
ncbi:FlxA-like family protein [Microvirgula aerodenitrificans]|uniref:FlxA-like family protein n=1 Tax=Microvirgula aerodenitrificans TaxID=57480 RepID=UPI0028E75BDE|nr:FlxA-like family protein [Microvirgula aerodenitrificans]